MRFRKVKSGNTVEFVNFDLVKTISIQDEDLVFWYGNDDFISFTTNLDIDEVIDFIRYDVEEINLFKGE